MGLARAFLRRDWLLWISYRSAAIQQFLGLAVLIVIVYVFGRNFAGDVSPKAMLLRPAEGVKFADETGNYVAFALAGIALSDAFMSGLRGIPRAIRDGQLSGTIETMLLTPIRPWQMVAASGLFNVVLSLVRTLIVFVFGYVALGFWHQAAILPMLAVFIPGFLCFVALGLFSASFVLLLKQGDPIVLAYAGLSGIIGGTLFPTSALPEWIQPVVFLLPLSYALSGMRLALEGAPLFAVVPQIIALCVFSGILLPLGFLAFRGSFNRARRVGSLGYY